MARMFMGKPQLSSWIDAALPFSKRLREPIPQRGLDEIQVEPAKHGDRLTHLLQVPVATWASAQVCLQARALGRRQRILQVVRYALYQVMAGKFV